MYSLTWQADSTTNRLTSVQMRRELFIAKNFRRFVPPASTETPLAVNDDTQNCGEYLRRECLRRMDRE